LEFNAAIGMLSDAGWGFCGIELGLGLGVLADVFLSEVRDSLEGIAAFGCAVIEDSCVGGGEAFAFNWDFAGVG
jgi:hypothetical protein